MAGLAVNIRVPHGQQLRPQFIRSFLGPLRMAFQVQIDLYWMRRSPNVFDPPSSVENSLVVGDDQPGVGAPVVPP